MSGAEKMSGWDWWTCAKCGNQMMKRLRIDGTGFLSSALGRCYMCPPKVIPKAIRRPMGTEEKWTPE